MIIPIDPNRTVEWAFPGECHTGKATDCPCGAKPCSEENAGTPLPDASVFLIGAPSELQRAEILDSGASMSNPDANGDRSIAINTGSIRSLRLRYGLRGVVRNFPGWDTTPDPHGGSRHVPTLHFLATIPDSVAAEMDTAIVALTDLSEDTVGKSEQPSGPPGEAPAANQTHAGLAGG